MKKLSLLIVSALLAILSNSYGQFSAQIVSTTSDLGGGRWEYSYDITNTGTETIEELTIWFDYADYSNFTIDTTNPLGWSELIIVPDELTSSGGGYDILNTTPGLLSSNSLSNFSVSFDYAGTAPASTQIFEIINPTTFETEYIGNVVPEPLTISILAAGALFLRRKRSNRR